LFVSSPLRTAKLNIPEDVLRDVISHLTLSLEPLAKAPPVSSEPSLFIIVPSEMVESTNGTSFTILLATNGEVIRSAVEVPILAAAIVNVSSMAYPLPAAVTVIESTSANKSPAANTIVAADDPAPSASAAIVNESEASYPNPAVVTVILEIVFELTTTVAIAPVPEPPVNDTPVYVSSTPSVGLTVIEVNKASAVVNIFPLETLVTTVAVAPLPPPLVVVATSVKVPAVPPLPPLPPRAGGGGGRAADAG